MKKKALLFLVIGLLISTASLAVAQEQQSSRPQWSVGIQGGLVIPGQYSFNDTAGPNVAMSNMNASNSLLLGLKAGWTPNFLQQYFTSQLEYFHVFGPNTDYQALYSEGGDTASLKFNATIDALFLNFILRYPEGRWHPFIGVGPGWAWVKLSDVQATITGTGRVDMSKVKESSSQFAWQVFAGLEFDITRNWSADMSYRYYGIDRVTFDEFDTRMNGQSINLGINYKF